MPFKDRSQVTKIDTAELPVVVLLGRGRKGTAWAAPLDGKWPNSRTRGSIRDRFREAKRRKYSNTTYPLGNSGSISYMATVNAAIAAGEV